MNRPGCCSGVTRKVSLVWSANDEMAFGAMQAYSETGGVPGKDALFSAVNSSPTALQALLDGRLSVLVGGHFTLGGWALVELHDRGSGCGSQTITAAGTGGSRCCN